MKSDYAEPQAVTPFNTGAAMSSLLFASTARMFGVPFGFTLSAMLPQPIYKLIQHILAGGDITRMRNEVGPLLGALATLGMDLALMSQSEVPPELAAIISAVVVIGGERLYREIFPGAPCDSILPRRS